jgi:hypothetical protein
MEAGDTNVETGDPANADQNLQGAASSGGGDIYGGGGGQVFGGGSGADVQAPDQVQTPDQGGGGGPAPALGGGGASVAGSTPSAGGIPGWAWLVGLGALALMAAGKKRKGKR